MRRICLISMALLAALACIPLTTAGATESVVRVGPPPPLPAGATVEGGAAAGRELQLMVALEPRDPAALERFANAVSTPGSGSFGDYVTVPEFARRFGATAADIADVRGALEREGLEVGAAGRNHLSLPVSATVAEAEAAFGVSIQRVRMASGRIAYRNNRAPAIPVAAAPEVVGVIGLDSTSESHRAGEAAPTPAVLGTVAAAGDGPTTRVVTGGPQPCKAALDKQKNEEGGYTADQIAAAYQLDGFYAAGNFGVGQKVALLEMEPFLPSDIQTYQDCYGTDVKITEVDVNGGPGPYAGEDGESALDIEQLIGLAPGVEIIVYQGPNTAEAPILSAWVEQNVAKVMSSSWGECEEKTPKAEMAAISTLLQEAAAQGQSFFVAAGDTGSEDCYFDNPSDKSISVDTPGSQPFATDVGGTQMTEPGLPPTEYLWNDGPEEGGGGGGVSEHFPMPAYQAEAAPATGVINALSTGSTCGFSGFCRQVPDVSANASPETPYIVFSEEKWQLAGGTSAAAPLWAALAALTNASPACQGHSIGFANPALYRIADNAYAANFHDVTAGMPGGPQTNDILFGGTKPFPAKAGYDMATGLGTPVGPTLAASLCAYASARPPAADIPPGLPPVSKPRLLHAAFRGLARGRPRLNFALVARLGTALHWVAVKVPAGLAFTDSRADLARGTVAAGPAQKRVRVQLRARGRTLMIRFARPLPSAHFILRPPALGASPALVEQVRRTGRRSDLRLIVTTGEGDGRSGRLAFSPRR